MPQVVKQYENVDITVEKDAREVVAIISTDDVDRDGEVVQPKGMKKKNFQGNPVVLVNHDYKSLPVGKALWVKSSNVDGRDVLIAKTKFSDKTELSRDTFGLFQDGILNAFSIGFDPIRASKATTQEVNARPELKGVTIFREWELVEYSAVGVPANPKALALAVSKGYSEKTIDIISGKTAVEKEVAEEIVEEVKEEIVEAKKHVMTETDIRKMIAKRLDRFVVDINPDRVFAKALDSLKSGNA